MRRPPPITDPAEAALLLAADPDERVIRTITPNGVAWQLHRAGRQVDPSTVNNLLRCGPTLSPNPGALIASNDGLFRDQASTQTYRWQPHTVPQSTSRRPTKSKNRPPHKPEAQTSSSSP